MASIRVFCDRRELEDWLVLLAEKKNLGIIAFGESNYGVVTDSDTFQLRDDFYHAFLFPKELPPKSE